MPLLGGLCHRNAREPGCRKHQALPANVGGVPRLIVLPPEASAPGPAETSGLREYLVPAIAYRRRTDLAWSREADRSFLTSTDTGPSAAFRISSVPACRGWLAGGSSRSGTMLARRRCAGGHPSLLRSGGWEGNVADAGAGEPASNRPGSPCGRCALLEPCWLCRGYIDRAPPSKGATRPAKRPLSPGRSS